MRILFVSHYALPQIGGIEVVVDALARELVARGHDVTHIASASRHANDGDQPYRVIRLKSSNIVASTLRLPYPLPYGGVRQTLETEIANADVVHAHGMLYVTSNRTLRIARRRGHPCRILTEHVGPLDSFAPLALVERAANEVIGRSTARAAQAIVAINPDAAPMLKRYAPNAQVVTIPNGVHPSFHPPASKERARRVLFIGRLAAIKRVHVLIEAARGADFELLVVGPGRLDIDIPPNVQLLGAQPPDRVAELCRSADVFVLPSVREGFPLTVAEAMASGLPVIVSDHRVYERLTAMGAGEAATFAESTPDALRAAIRNVLASDAGTLAADVARREFSWSRAVDEYLALYERVRAS